MIGLQEAAERLGVHYMTVYRYVRTGRLPAVKRGGEWRVEPAALERLRRVQEAPRRRRPPRAGAAERLLDRLLAGDELGAWNVVESALASGAQPSEVHLDLVVPALRTIGEDWAAGRLSVADEHRASVVARRILGRLGVLFTRRGRKRACVVLGAVAGERHEIPGAIVADQLRAAGFDVVDLGADTPTESFVAAAHRYRPLCVLISVTAPGHDAALRATVAALRAEADVALLVGGAAVPDERTARAVGSEAFTGTDARAVVAAVENMLARRLGG